MIKFGMISECDATTLQRTIGMAAKFCTDPIFKTIEIGIFDGDSSRGINEFVKSLGLVHEHTAIDNGKYFTIQQPFPECKLIIGNSHEEAWRIADHSQHFIFIDACHSFPAVVADFFCYADKIKVGGYISFHDSGKHIKGWSGYQDVGSDKDPNMYISVRKALQKIGLLENKFPGWRLVFDDYDPNDEFGGVCSFKKVDF